MINWLIKMFKVSKIVREAKYGSPKCESGSNDLGKELFNAWKENDPYFRERINARSFTGSYGSAGHPCPGCKIKYVRRGRPCYSCQVKLELWCPCPKPITDWCITSMCIRCGLQIKELCEYEDATGTLLDPELDAELEDALYDKYEKMSNYHLCWYRVKCKIKEPPD